MSIFGTIMSKIFHHADAAPGPAGTADAPSSSATPGADTTASAAPVPGGTTGGGAAAGGSAASGTAAGGKSVDVAAVLDGLAAKNSQTLDWKHSIVDLMKLLDLDSSLQNRKALAKELDYTGSTDDSATMNVWLHSQVMKKLAENGGQVPADLRT